MFLFYFILIQAGFILLNFVKSKTVLQHKYFLEFVQSRPIKVYSLNKVDIGRRKYLTFFIFSSILISIVLYVAHAQKLTAWHQKELFSSQKMFPYAQGKICQ